MNIPRSGILVLLSFIIVLVAGSALVYFPKNYSSTMRFVQPVEGMLVGGHPSAFGLLTSHRAGLSMFNDNLVIRWETIHTVPIVTGITSAWTLEDQQDFLDSGQSLASLADQFVRKWAPADALYVTQTRLGVGGTVLFAYRSDILRRALGYSDVSRTETGDFYVVIVLDTSFEDSEVPVAAADFVNQANLEEAMFTIGLVIGQPWTDRSQ